MGTYSSPVFISFVFLAYLTVHSQVYGKPDSVVVCIEDHKFQPQNFWNGKWRAQWTLSKDGKVNGEIKTQVHYYEDGNVQLRTEKIVEESITVGSEKDTASAFVSFISKTESAYQNAVSENYNTMSSTTFKALRRALPITRQKVIPAVDSRS